MRRIFPTFMLVSIVAALLGCERHGAAKSDSVSAPAPVSVRVARPHRGAISRWVALPAEIRPLQQATLYAKTAGYLKTIHVDKGDAAKADTVLAEIESPELLADEAKFKAELEVAQINAKRLNEARDKAPDLVIAQAIDEAKGKLDIAKANLERNETLLAYTKIIAPFAGVVTRRWVDVGAFIPAATSGSAAQNAALLTLMDFSSVRIDVAVPENEVPFIKVGVPVKLSIEELPGKIFEGKVTRFSYALDDATKTMLTEIELPNPQQELRPGMFATTRIAVQTKTDAFLVPADAVLVEKQKTSVFKIADGKAKKVAVKVGFQDGASAEILEGVNADESVILVGKQALNDGQPVKVTQ